MMDGPVEAVRSRERVGRMEARAKNGRAAGVR